MRPVLVETGQHKDQSIALPAGRHGRSRKRQAAIRGRYLVVPRPGFRLQQASAQVLRDPELLNKLRNAGYDVEPSIGDDFGAELRTDIDRWVRVIRDAKIPRE